MSLGSVAVLLPVLGFLLAFSVILRREGAGREGGFHRPFLLSAIGWGVFVTVSTELLSLVRGLVFPAVAGVWLLACVVLGIVALRTNSIPYAWARVWDSLRSLTVVEKALLGGVLAICAALLAVALISPPNSFDAMFYHLPRVLHWLQDASLRPYPPVVDHQLNKPIWAETAILHLRVLWGTDRPANLVQWFSMIGSLVGAAGIAGLLKAGRRGQFLAVAFCISIPMGILQASTSLNDYVAAFWGVSVAYLVVAGIMHGLTAWEYLALAGAVGVGALTKGTFFIFGPLFVAWLLLHELFARRFRQAILGGLVIAGLAAALNAGFWYRNIQVYGGPYGTSEWLQQNLWIRVLPQASAAPGGAATPEGGSGGVMAMLSGNAEPGSTSVAGGQSALTSYLVRLAQVAGRNLTAPTHFLSSGLLKIVEAFPGVFGKGYEDELRGAAWNHEDFAGNPLHLLFVPVGFILLLFARRTPEKKTTLVYAGVCLLAYALIPVVISHSVTQAGVRYQLSFFVLWPPVVGAAFGYLGRKKLEYVMTAAFLIVALPWVLFSNMRPLIDLGAGRTRVSSILAESQQRLLYALNENVKDDYALPAQAIQAAGCKDVGLAAGAGFLEYPLWWELNAPQSGVRIESIDVTPALNPYVDPQFKPCAVVCANCTDQLVRRDLPYVGTYDSIKLYMRP